MTNLTRMEENYINPTSEIYTLYNNKGIVIAAVTIGDDNGTTTSYAYITGPVDREEYGHSSNAKATEGKWTWYRNAIVDGEKTRLTQTGDANTLDLDQLFTGEWYEIKYTANGDVRRSEWVSNNNEKTAYHYTTSITADQVTSNGTNWKYVNSASQVETAINNVSGSTVLLHDQTTVDQLRYSNGILYTNTNDTKGLHLSPEVKTVVGNANASGSELSTVTDGYNGYTGVEKAIKDMNCQGTNSGVLSDGTRYIELGVLLVDGFATVVVINDKTPSGIGASGGVLTAADGLTTKVDVKAGTVDMQVPNADSDVQVRNKIKEALGEYGISVGNRDISGPTVVSTGLEYYEVETKDGDWFDVTVEKYYSIKVDGRIVDWVFANNSKTANKTIDLSSGYKGTNYYFGSSTPPTSGGFNANNSYNNTYAAHGTPITKGTTVIKSDVTITTGYLTWALSASSTEGIGTGFDVTGTTNAASANIQVTSSSTIGNYVAHGGNLTVTLETTGAKDFSADNIEWVLSYTENDTNNVDPAQTKTVAGVNHTASGETVVSFEIKDITKKLTDIKITGTKVVAPHSVTVQLHNGTTNVSKIDNVKGLTISASAETNEGKAGEAITVAVTIMGKVNNAGHTGVTLSLLSDLDGGTPSDYAWSNKCNQIDGMTLAVGTGSSNTGNNAKLKIADGTDYRPDGVTVYFTIDVKGTAPEIITLKLEDDG